LLCRAGVIPRDSQILAVISLVGAVLLFGFFQ
jgi:hypothetical protein